MSKPIIHIEHTDVAATVTTWIYCAFSQMWSLENQGYDAYINWPAGYKPPRCLQPLYDKDQFQKQPNSFEWYFKQPKVEYALRNDVWTWGHESKYNDGKLIYQEPLSVIKDYYKKNLIFSDAVNNRGYGITGKYAIDFNRTIGITWRGTDNVTDGRPRLSIDVYFPWIDDILNDHPDYRIMATAEEEGILEPLLMRYSNAFTIEEFVSSPYGSKHNPERIDNRSGFERGMQPALMVWLFSKCSHYIKNRSSTGAVASWLSNGRIVNLAHEETLSYHKIEDQVEINGIKYPLYR